MNSSALTIMITAQVIITFFTVYFFIKVLRTPNKDEADFPPGP
jgi:hypothetical protein